MGEIDGEGSRKAVTMSCQHGKYLISSSATPRERESK